MGSPVALTSGERAGKAADALLAELFGELQQGGPTVLRTFESRIAIQLEATSLPPTCR